MTALLRPAPSSIPPPVPRWRRSSHSTGANNCVETAPWAGRLAVRDSKRPDGPALLFSPESWAGFTGSFR